MLVLLTTLAACSSNEDLVYPEINNKIAPEEIWSASVGNGVEHYDSALRPLIYQDKVFAASRAGLVMAFDRESGKRLWTFDVRNDGTGSLLDGLKFWSSNTARVSGGVSYGYDKLFVGTENGDVLALNPETGELVWRVKVKGEVIARPAAGEGYVLVNTSAGYLFALHPDTGEQRWMHEQESALLSLRGTSEPVVANGGVIFGSGAGKVSVLIADKGILAWDAAIAVPKGATDLSRMVDVDATPIVVDGTIYAIAFNGELVALELRTGRVMWKREYASFRDMTIEGNTIYLVDSVGKIFAIDRRNGLEQWAQLGLHKHFLTGPTVYKDYLAIGDVEGNLFWLDKNSGDFVAQESYSSGFYVQGVSSADELVIQTRDGELSLIRLP
ncbi:MAG: outer membrane protein assembly factor BamB [Gammaproteobacteria bacterium]|nr:outer membrane protein assembly factor BamB [Gammaproteobacteria bacterium]MBU2056291.1 outer membrane protein assembly factor BamB [Gammaproteobacteria bacterium]MBU2177184.1 outer membrane protein assembly factor BamB [Gammaproteobacteria bacterium]MBU2246087.1 outer membrane protein assembly factor BamB [Gammaproteobacteria bacterium]MBU2344710.1 outer membrane protein assembly factor BamB [Gammaproteobacteria bacterium]